MGSSFVGILTIHKREKVLAIIIGMGKSKLLNALVGSEAQRTNEISMALGSGKHTTTSTTWYWVDDTRRTALIDSPGFQEFGLNHIDPALLASYMPDLKVHIKDCKFYNCSHLHEPGCGVMAAVSSAELPSSTEGISAHRYKIYSELHAELSQKRTY